VAAALAVMAIPAVVAASVAAVALAVAAAAAVVAASVAAAAAAVAAAPAVAVSAVAEPAAGVVESIQGQAERIGLSPVQRLMCWQRAVSCSPLP